MRVFVSSFIGLISLFWSCSVHNESAPPMAVASVFRAESVTDSTYNIYSSVLGNVVIEDLKTGGIRMTLSFEGLPPNSTHAVHMHSGSCESPSFEHWNRGSQKNYCLEKSLGIAWSKPAAGDIGNVKTDENGTGELVVESDFWSVNTNDETDILGNVLVVHERGEDFIAECYGGMAHDHTNNKKIACGSIQLP